MKELLDKKDKHRYYVEFAADVSNIMVVSSIIIGGLVAILLITFAILKLESALEILRYLLFGWMVGHLTSHLIIFWISEHHMSKYNKIYEEIMKILEDTDVQSLYPRPTYNLTKEDHTETFKKILEERYGEEL